MIDNLTIGSGSMSMTGSEGFVDDDEGIGLPDPVLPDDDDEGAMLN